MQSNRLQQTATDCNRLQQTAAHCSTLQYTATHCNIVFQSLVSYLSHPASNSHHQEHTATHCNTLQHTATHCNTLQYTATQWLTSPIYWSSKSNKKQQTASRKWRKRGRWCTADYLPIAVFCLMFPLIVYISIHCLILSRRGRWCTAHYLQFAVFCSILPLFGYIYTRIFWYF